MFYQGVKETSIKILSIKTLVYKGQNLKRPLILLLQ